MPESTQTRRRNMVKYPQSCKKWTSGEIKYLKDHWGTEEIDVISSVLQRTRMGVYNKAEDLGLNKRAAADPVILEVTHETKEFSGPIITVNETDAALDLVMWFCQEAYMEGHAIEIPALGARFQKGAAWPTYR